HRDRAAPHRHQARAIRLPGRDGDCARAAFALVRAALGLERAPALERTARSRGRRGMMRATEDPRWVRVLLIAVALGFLGLLVVLPLVSVFTNALARGLAVYLAAIREPEALSAIKLTLVTAAISVPANLVFGIAAAWAIAKFDFPGKQVLITL